MSSSFVRSLGWNRVLAKLGLQVLVSLLFDCFEKPIDLEIGQESKRRQATTKFQLTLDNVYQKI